MITINNKEKENSLYQNLFSSFSLKNFFSRTITLYGSAENDLRAKLPDELWVHIMLCLRSKDILNLGQVSSGMRDLAQDRHVWRKIAKRENIHCPPNFDPKGEYMTLRRIHKLAINKRFCDAMAKALGPHRFIKLMKKRSNKMSSGTIAYVDIKQEGVIFKCFDHLSHQSFSLKVINHQSGNMVLSCSGGAQKMSSVRGIAAKDLCNQRISLDEEKINYFTRLINGQPCGLYVQGKEERERLVEGRPAVTLLDYNKDPKK